jgi:pSer/pThr/pTyr-binding forkhead associated (FHA) protein
VRCASCGNDNPDEFPFCIECGSRVDAAGPRQVEPDRRPHHDEYRPAYDDRQGYNDQRHGYDQRPPAYDDQRNYQPAPAPQPRPAPAQPGARLILESGLGKQEYPLDAPVVTIGRSRSNDISLDDARVSRHHARIVRDARGYLIEDLNSRNGTRVGDRAVRDSAVLDDGAILKIGDAVFRFVMSGGGHAPTPVLPPDPYRQDQPTGAAPVVFLAPWQPVQCPGCQGHGTMRPIIYGQAATDRAAQEAARRGEVVLGEGTARPDGPNAECRTCGLRVRVVPTSS